MGSAAGPEERDTALDGGRTKVSHANVIVAEKEQLSIRTDQGGADMNLCEG